MPRTVARLAGVLILACCAACGSQSSRLEPGTPVVLISIDTLRADRLPAYGYQEIVTPAIDRIAGDGIVFENAFCHYPLTLPSHVTIFSGLLPGEHRVRDNVGYPLDPEQVPLLQRAFRATGYRTGGFVSSFVLRRGSGIAEGFEIYDDGIDFTTGAGLAGLQRAGGETLQRASRWLDEVRGEPFLLFFHIYEPHSPYTPPEPFASRYSSAYDGEVATADDVVGRLLEKLDALDLYDRSLILLFSDHGEGLGQHGEQEHGVFLYSTTLQVPLVLKLPHSARAGSRVGTTVQLADVAPTVLDLLGLPRDPRLAGGHLLTAMSGELGQRAVYAETFYPRLHFGWSELFSIVRGRHHLIEAPEPELFDLVDDPDETRNLVAARPEIHGELVTELESFDRSFDEPTTESAETIRRLASLGYVGRATTAVGESLPDPKTQIGALDELRRAAGLLGQRSFAEAVPALEALLSEQPRIQDAWDYLARAFDGLGRSGDALRVYEEALSRFPDSPLLALSAAQLQFRLGLADQAAPLAEAAVEVDPAAAQALLSQIALDRGDLPEAERRARLAREARDNRPGPDLAWAAVLIARDRLDEALRTLHELETRLAADQDPQLLRGVSFLRGKALATMGQAGEAEQAFMLEIERFPLEPQAYTHLAVMYGLLGMQREAVVVIGKLLRLNASPHVLGEAIKTLDLVGARPQADRVVEEARRRYPDDARLRTLIEKR